MTGKDCVMNSEEYLEILHVAERLKDTPRHCTTTNRRPESVAEHSWRVSLMAMLLRQEFPDVNMDRVVDMAAALSMYGKQVVVCDLGTCTTITVASDKIIGGMICPGIQLSLDAEASRASQLPQLSASEVRTLLGNDTASNMISGVVAGTGMMISELAKRLRMGAMTLDFTEDKNVAKEMPDLKVVVTGGLGRLVLPWIKQGLPPEIEAYYDENLLIRGLKEIYFLNT